MKLKTIFGVAALVGCLACNKAAMTVQEGYIAPSDIQIVDGHMTPEVLLSLGRLSDPQLSPDGKSILYGVSYTSIAENRSVRNLFLLPVEGGEKTQLTWDGKSISNARWSPEGDAVYFLQEGQVWKASFVDGKLGKRLKISEVSAGIVRRSCT